MNIHHHTVFSLDKDNSNVFLGTVSNLWSNPANWSYGHLPTSSEKARIHAACTLDIDTTVNELLVDPTFTLSWESDNTRALTVNNDYTNQGTVNMSYGNLSHNLVLNGTNLSSTGGFNAGTGYSIVTYAGTSDQNILNLIYRSLTFSGTGTKTLTANTTIPGSAIINAPVNCGSNTLTTSGHLTLSNSITGTNTLDFNTVTVSFGAGINVGTANINLRGSMEGNGFSPATITANEIRIKNNLTIAPTSNLIINADVVIESSRTLTVANVGGNSNLSFNKTITGVDSTSQLKNDGIVSFYFNHNIMATGTFIQNASVRYAFNGNYTIPFSTFTNLFIAGTGDKKLSSNLTCNSLNLSNGTLDLDVFTIQVNAGGLYMNGTIKNNVSATNLLHRVLGPMQVTANVTINLGTNDLELNAGLSREGFVNFSITCRDIIIPTTQTILLLSVPTNVNANIKILNNCNLTLGWSASFIYLGTIDGLGANSKLIPLDTIRYNNSQSPMLTGILDANINNNTFIYTRLGDQDVKGGTYRTIQFDGSGVKKLLGNVVVNVTAGGSQSTTGTATIDLNGFTITTI